MECCQHGGVVLGVAHGQAQTVVQQWVHCRNVLDQDLAGFHPLVDLARIGVGKLHVAARSTADELVATADSLGGLAIVVNNAGVGHTPQPLDELSDQVEAWKRQGLKVGFTNGCFDMLHAGHVSLLRQAANACDRLIVALNTDASVRGLKGPERPVQSEDVRAAVMAAVMVSALVVAAVRLVPMLHPLTVATSPLALAQTPLSA